MIRTEKQAKSRGGRSVKRKGSAYELEVMDDCVKRGFDCTRTVASGARNQGEILYCASPITILWRSSVSDGANVARSSSIRCAAVTGWCSVTIEAK